MVKVGDRVRVTRNGKYNPYEFVGSEGTLIAIDVQDDEVPYLVWVGRGGRPDGHKFGMDNGDWWCAEVELVNNEDWRRLSDEEVKLVKGMLWEAHAGRIEQPSVAVALHNRLESRGK